MNNESEKEMTAAGKTYSSLQASSAEAASDPDVFRLGQLLRESASSELPPVDASLRELLMDGLESSSGERIGLARTSEMSKDTVKGRSDSRRNWILAFSSVAALAVAIGGTIWVNYSPREFSLVGGMNLIGDLEFPEAPASNSEHGGGDEAEPGASAFPDVDAPKLEDSLEAVTDAVSNVKGDLGKTINLPMLEHTTENTVVSVPDGGTILLGGIKREYGVDRGGQSPFGNDSFYYEGVVGGVQTPTPKQRGESLFAGGGGGAGGMEGPSLVFPPAKAWQGKVARRSKYADIRVKNDEERILGGLGGGGFDGRGGRGFGEKGFVESRAGEQYDAIVENQFLEAIKEQLSTFSIDVDTASYANMRRFVSSGQLPPPNSVRIEEFVNYFNYDYPQPVDGKPFSVSLEAAECPWQPAHRLVRIGIKGKEIHRDERPASNLVFLLDVSGSMNEPSKLPLLQRGLQMMLDRLNENDRVSIVTYAGNAGIRLQPTSGDQKIKIRDVVESLSAGGSTNGSAGIEMAYQLAAENFITGGVNRVLLATDGDLNVGITDDQSLVKLISEKASEGVFLTVLGFGTGNLKDSKMEKLADNGNGVYAYIDSLREAHKVLVQQMSGSLVTIAKDVKLQVEFNPGRVQAYRLIGYENRKLANADFADDKKDAGEIGAGHTVTALYEVVPVGVAEPAQPLSTNLKYKIPGAKEEREEQRQAPLDTGSDEMLTVSIRFKLPEQNESEKIEFALTDAGKTFYDASGDFRFASSVAAFGMLLRNSQFRGNIDMAAVEKIASGAIGEDHSGYRAEFVDLLRRFGNR